MSVRVFTVSIPFINPFSAMTRFHIHSAYYLVVLYNFRYLCGD
ncbi:hypothetical protein E2C01_045293 [Portunus trituberculatus]|uniref:Uncharacterized protein n=1 Tax=Portunus trituberculatus TaxID=210409 RepID=A0A5B7G2S9_PORTR|nr:hypothetical protein [Portunus trituberculatus]